MTEHTAEKTDWRKMHEFVGVDLARSFVLSWHFESGILFVDIDVLLTPEHPFYETPRPAEKVCIRPACIEFPFCESFGKAGESEGKLADIARNLGAGAITGLNRLASDRYEISGDFGTVLIDAERPHLKLKQN